MLVVYMIGGGLALLVVSRLLRPPPETLPQANPTARRRLWSGLARLAFGLGIVVYVLGLAYGGMSAYLAYSERVSPSTERVLTLKDGREVPLVQPARLTNPQTGASLPQLPPVRVRIPAVGADWPVALSDVDALPRFQAVGWLIGTAFPGAPGNLVLFGQREGPYATFTRLDEVKPGDEVTLDTERGSHRYRVRAMFETTGDDVSALAPTEQATVTLITPATGATGEDARYLIVTADYTGP